jgi:hypothetical protein
MNQDTENFEQLRLLLKLKRYEQPPPGYFNDFSSQVIARIKLGERGENSAVIEGLLWEAPWLQRLWAAFEAKPILAGAFGLAVCCVLISGMIYSEKGDVQPVALIPPVTESIPNAADVANVMAMNHPLLAQPAAFEVSSTNPVARLLTDGPMLIHAQDASFPFSGKN